MQSLFDAPDYKAYLNSLLQQRGRGERSRWALATGCHLAYVSKVLNGDSQFSLEQAEALARHLRLPEDEVDHFLLLVSHSRAGSRELRRRLETQLDRARLARAHLENRLKLKKILPSERQAIYYSAWYYSAIHVLLSIPAFQTQDAIVKRLQITPAQAARALEFLTEAGLAAHSKGRYQTGEVALHLQHDSPWTGRHHASWRVRALQAVERAEPRNFHYTSVVSMAASDAPAAHLILVDAIEKVRALIRPSAEEELYCYSLDFFDV